ncbi:hypothetical protein GS624_03575 [Ruegeria sp. HKCCD5849]|uniref:hypothetical protein n=1 Tax=unclassified Ruegeria TaxID=2625375 RepID=UPI0014910F0C|nr:MULTISPECIES: hypothetical protein [unclassified Ruegeria]NOD46384.1 hypothetical protein [Ruegeria sp. HKCCD5849]NOD50316.1 hypothetical protein [Ruegeria sp. HKCCD5851]
MSGNPFDAPPQTRAGDKLYIDGVPLDAKGSTGGDHVVHFDPVAQTASPNGVEMLKWILAQVRKEQMQHTEATVKAVAKAVKPYEKRIAQLEQQLAKAQAEVTDAIGKALHQFNADDTDDATEIVKKAMRENPEAYR